MPETARAKASREWRERNPERNKQLQANYRANNKVKTKEAIRRWNLRTKYGISEEEYDALLEAQDGFCAICNLHAMDMDERFCVDHDHITGEVRGLLCRRCNLGLAHFREFPLFLENAIRYLKRFDDE